ncbi:MAG TPA: preprotein translocase subunit YajC [Acidimicrobiales bacterium]
MYMTLLAASSSSSSGSPIVALLPFILIAVAMYFLLIRPQRRRMAEQRNLASAVQEGDEVMTTAGIYGFVTAIDGDVIWLDIADGVDIRIARQAVSRRIPAAEEAPSLSAPTGTSADGADDEQDTDPASANGTKGERDAPSAD